MKKYLVAAVLSAIPVIAWAGVVPPPPGQGAPQSALDSGAVMGKKTQAEYNEFVGQKAFAQGADNGSGQFHLPTSPVSGANPVSPAFRGVGRIPENAPPPPTSAAFDAHPAVTANAAAHMPAQNVPYTPPPAGATPTQIHQAAMNTAGYSSAGEVPHMSFAQARKDSTPVTGKTIRVENGVTYGVPVSGVAPNLFVTPFHHPQVIVGNTRYAKRFTHGRDIFIGSTISFPVGIYITGENPEDPVVSLTLIPGKTPAKIYHLVFPGFVPNQAPSVPDHSAYASQMVALMRDVVMNQVPEDYRQSHRITPLNVAIPLSWAGEKRWVGNHDQILEYRIQNNLSRKVTLTENDFYSRGVEAVSLYPHHLLYPGESTRLYMVETLPPSRHGLGDVWR
ncbi:hypothetical protein B1757_02405 [Acidithiobacillus marinus]|uniref:TraK C-terminal domain-containing protein n=1 Tax=Acidithiobacillus marinus TaxID=187490 RepID=A0A2I1DPQ5_9PROT|nr:type-F conjugative transfer system secretin TraK [Acidithiobacillus marinus]PKY11832.1 hypothetical protein B1757_02405 [Acidithiobacillus marinus]